jgi:copper chaperone CopZ
MKTHLSIYHFALYRSAICVSILATAAFSLPASARNLLINVNGMVCSFCAQGIQKKLTAQEAVGAVDVNLAAHVVKVELKEGKDLDDQTVTQILTDAGYSVSKIERQK